MKRFITGFLSLLMLFLIFGCGQTQESARSTGFAETAFSATMLAAAGGSTEPTQSKYYKDGDKLRTEAQMYDVTIVYISRKDKNLVWTVVPENKAYVEQLYTEAKVRAGEVYLAGQRTKIGEETVDGHPCIKYEVTPSHQPEIKSIEWQAKDLRNFPIRVEGSWKTPQGGMVKTLVQFKDINFNKPSAELFEVPKDYKRVANLAEALGSKMQSIPKGLATKKKRS